MVEIIPNWHPIFVHFTIALFSVATAFYALYFVSQRLPIFQRLKFYEFEIVARWCLWIAGLITMATIGAGLYAYYTVKHDAISHEAMINHRDWAICTAIAVFLTALWSIWLYIKQQSLTLTFMLILLTTQCLLLSTAWRGGELVYRYGLGVLSLPQAEETDHQHSIKAHPSPDKMIEPNREEPNHDNHEHQH